MIMASLAFAAMGVCVQIAARSLPNAEVVWARNFIGLLFMLPWIATRGFAAALHTKKPIDHLVRIAAGLGGMYCFFFAVSHMRLADAVLLNYTVPLFIPIIEALWLREPMPGRLWPPLALGFVGVALVLRPGSDFFSALSLLGLASGPLSAVAQTGVRRLTRTEPPERIIFYFALVSSLVSAGPAAASWIMPPAHLLGLLVLLGLCATIGQLCMTRAYARAPASQVGGFMYSAVLFAALFDWARTREPPTFGFAVGAALICGAGALMLRLAARTPP